MVDYSVTQTTTFSFTDTTYNVDNENSWETSVYAESNPFTLPKIEAEEEFSINTTSTWTTTPERTTINYSIVQNGDETLPSWITFNDSSNKLEGTAPKFAVNNTYSFVIQSEWEINGTPESSSQVVDVEVSSQEYSDLEETAIESAIVSSQVLIGVSATATIGMSAIRGSSFGGFYLVLHQLKMIILILLIDPFIPGSVMKYIEGQSFALVTFNFISSKDIPVLKEFVKWIGRVQDDKTLEMLKFESESMIANHIAFFLVLFTIFCIHLIIKYWLRWKTCTGSHKPHPKNIVQ